MTTRRTTDNRSMVRTKAELSWALISYDEKGRKWMGALGDKEFPGGSFIRYVHFNKNIPRTALVQIFINGEPQLMPVESGVPLEMTKSLFGEHFHKTSMLPPKSRAEVEVHILTPRKKFPRPPQVSIMVEKRPELPGPKWFIPLGPGPKKRNWQ